MTRRTAQRARNPLLSAFPTTAARAVAVAVGAGKTSASSSPLREHRRRRLGTRCDGGNGAAGGAAVVAVAAVAAAVAAAAAAMSLKLQPTPRAHAHLVPQQRRAPASRVMAAPIVHAAVRRSNTARSHPKSEAPRVPASCSAAADVKPPTNSQQTPGNHPEITTDGRGNRHDYPAQQPQARCCRVSCAPLLPPPPPRGAGGVRQ